MTAAARADQAIVGNGRGLRARRDLRGRPAARPPCCTAALLHGGTRPFAGPGGVIVPVALAAVTSLGVLLTGQMLEVSLQGLELSMLGGGVLTGVAEALGARPRAASLC